MEALLMGRRTRLLLGVLAFAGLLAVWTATGSEEESAAPGLAPAAPRAAARPPVDYVEEPLFAALTVRSPAGAPGRDPWRYGETPRPARFVRPSVVQPAPERAPLAVPSAPAPAAAAAPEPPRFPWTYLGSFGPVDRRIAVFADGSEVHNRREGEVLAGRFVLERIGIESVDVRPLDTPGAPAERLAPGAGRGRGMS